MKRKLISIILEKPNRGFNKVLKYKAFENYGITVTIFKHAVQILVRVTFDLV